MGVLDMLFGGQAAQPQPAQQAQQPAQQPAAQQQTTGTAGTDPNNPTVPAGAQQATQQPAETNPLDTLKDLWTTQQPDATQQQPASVLDLDPKQLMASAQKMDFSKVIKPEQLQAIAAGGEGAMQAFGQVLNTVTQASDAQSTLSASKLIKEALKEHGQGLDTRISETMRRNLATEGMINDRPELRHPAAQPVISAIQSQLAAKFPQATSAELRKLSEDYFTGLGSIFAPKKDQQQEGSGKPSADGMDDFLKDIDLL